MELIDKDEPVDGWSIEHTPEVVILTLTNRYSDGEAFEIDPPDAIKLGLWLAWHGMFAMKEQTRTIEPDNKPDE